MIPANPPSIFLNKNFPFVKDVQAGTKSAANKNTVVSIPSTRQSGDLIMVVICGVSDTAQSVSGVSSGWNRAVINNINFIRWFVVDWKISDGTETSLTYTSTQNHQSAFSVFIISGASSLSGATASTGTSGAPNCPNFSPSWGVDANLWLAVSAQFSLETPQAVLSGFTNFSEVSNVVSGVDRPRISWCRREDYSSSVNPPAYPNSISSGSNARWIATTIAIRG